MRNLKFDNCFIEEGYNPAAIYDSKKTKRHYYHDTEYYRKNKSLKIQNPSDFFSSIDNVCDSRQTNNQTISSLETSLLDKFKCSSTNKNNCKKVCEYNCLHKSDLFSGSKECDGYSIDLSQDYNSLSCKYYHKCY